MERKKNRIFSPQEIGGMLKAIKQYGTSYSHFATKYGVATMKIKRICEQRGVKSGFKEPKHLQMARAMNMNLGERRRSFLEKIFDTIFG